MAIAHTAADVGYYRVTAVKFAQRTAAKTYSTPIAISYAKSKSFTPPQADKIEQRANGTLIFNIPGEYSSTGKLACAGRDYNLEAALGSYIEGTDSGRIDVAPRNYVRGAIGYECEVYNSAGIPTAIRVWEYNVEINPQAEEKINGDQKNPDLGSYEYDYTGYGEILEAAGSTDDYTDANGIKRVIFRRISRYGDSDYDTFLATVATPKMPTISTP